MQQDIRPMTPEEIIKAFNDAARQFYGYVPGKPADDWLKNCLRALLLHVGGSIPQTWHHAEGRHLDGSYDDAYELGLADCKRVIEKMISQI